MVRGTAGTAAHREGGLTEPTFAGILRTGLPGFLWEGFLPVGAFYLGLQIGGLAVGIAASTSASVAIYLLERRAGRDALLVRLSLGFVLVQAAVGLAADSTTVYLAQPVLVTAVWGLAFLVSVPLGRPLAGALACAWYPFPRWFRETDKFKRVFGVESLVWGAYFFARSGIRLTALLQGSLESFLLIVFLTGFPAMLALMAWSIRYAMRELDEPDPLKDSVGGAARQPRDAGRPRPRPREELLRGARLDDRRSA
jgi:hypothetical protein